MGHYNLMHWNLLEFTGYKMCIIILPLMYLVLFLQVTGLLDHLHEWGLTTHDPPRVHYWSVWLTKVTTTTTWQMWQQHQVQTVLIIISTRVTVIPKKLHIKLLQTKVLLYILYNCTKVSCYRQNYQCTKCSQNGRCSLAQLTIMSPTFNPTDHFDAFEGMCKCTICLSPANKVLV